MLVKRDQTESPESVLLFTTTPFTPFTHLFCYRPIYSFCSCSTFAKYILISHADKLYIRFCNANSRYWWFDYLPLTCGKLVLKRHMPKRRTRTTSGSSLYFTAFDRDTISHGIVLQVDRGRWRYNRCHQVSSDVRQRWITVTKTTHSYYSNIGLN